MQPATNVIKTNIPSILMSAFIVAASSLIGVPPASAGNLKADAEISPEAASPGFSYDFLDLHYAYTEFDEYLGDSHGADVKFSKALTESLYVLGGLQYDQGDFESLPGTWDAFGIDVGLGAHIAVTDRLDLTFDLVANHNWFDGADESSDAWGLTAGPGFRFLVCPGFELYGIIGYNYDFEESGDLWDYRAGAVFDVNQPLGLNIGGFANEEAAGGFAGVRIHY